MLSQMGIAIIFALSYNMLLGQTGLLSFGHAVYYGLAAFICAHTLNAMAAGKFAFLPVTMLPLLGGICGLIFGVLFGYVTTRRAGTPFAMISLGIAVLGMLLFGLASQGWMMYVVTGVYCAGLGLLNPALQGLMSMVSGEKHGGAKAASVPATG